MKLIDRYFDALRATIDAVAADSVQLSTLRRSALRP